MPETFPKSPFRDREEDPEQELISEEIKSVLGIFELTRRLRAKVPEDPNDVDKTRDNITESAGDKTAMTAYLMHYFYPLVEKEGADLNYERTLDMVLSHNIGAIDKRISMPGVQQTLEQRREEVVSTAKIFGNLPQRNAFNKTLFNAYAEYLGRETREARFTRALNGLETMLYVLSRPPHLRAQLVGGKGYAIEDYRERIEPFCREFPPVQKFYTRIERIFHGKGYFAPSRVYENSVMRPDVARNTFVSSAPEFGNPDTVDVDEENERLLNLQRLKRQLLFGQDLKPAEEHNDTVTEHVATLLFLERYFLPIAKSDPRQSRKDLLSLFESAAMILSHDMPEAIEGDIATHLKTEANAVSEWDVATEIAAEFAPRAGGFNDEFWRYLEKYELDRARPPFVGNSWFVKVLDVLEAQFYIFDRETRNKLSRMHVLPREEVRGRYEKMLEQFPILKDHFDALEQKFFEEGLP
ncbi:MAG: HD domain-containing protein [Patescibacteria group bacterium]|nr:HD domain-containing protein [Patescibacteria group bacterium]